MVNPLKLQMPQLLLGSLLVCLFVLGIAWGPAEAEEDTPPGCDMVFTSTTRGGGTASVGGGGCSISWPSGNGKTRVLRVVDGDTIVVSSRQRVRYIGIDTPEVGKRPEYYGTPSHQL